MTPHRWQAKQHKARFNSVVKRSGPKPQTGWTIAYGNTKEGALADIERFRSLIKHEIATLIDRMSLGEIREVIDQQACYYITRLFTPEEQVEYITELYNARAIEAFKAEYELTDEDFATDHWQTLFTIKYPEVRS